jgi:soluble lytic murein transglycosylase-like protein
LKKALVFIYLILPVMLCSWPLYAKVYKRVLQDGTVEFYNKKENAGPHRFPQGLASRFDGLIEKLSSQYGVDPLLVKSIIKVESNFNPNAVSPAGAMGLMQIMQDTAGYYRLENPFDPERNIETGVRHLKSLLAFFENNVALSLAAYHAGLGRVKNRRLPPIRATIDYVNRVMLLYTGKASYAETFVRRLYKRIERDGTIVIYSK